MRRMTIRMRRVTMLLLMAGVVWPAAAEAQRRNDCCSRNPFSFTPYVGVMKDAYDLEADGSDTGLMLGFRAGYHETQRLGFHLNVAYGETNDVASRAPLDNAVHDNQWVFLTAGMNFVLVPGNTSVGIGGEAGVAWRNTKLASPGTTVPRDLEGWGAYDVVAPSLTVRHHFSPRTSLALTAHDYIFDVFEGDVQHSPALTLGLSFR